MRNTIITGDLSDPNDLRIHVQVINGSIVTLVTGLSIPVTEALKPWVDKYFAQGRTDSVWQAIVQRETGAPRRSSYMLEPMLCTSMILPGVGW